MSSTYIALGILIFYGACIPFALASDVRVTEVMYDPPVESERGYEWLEVCNVGNEEVHFTEWKFAENGKTFEESKSITATSSVPEYLSGGVCAIVSDNPGKFFEYEDAEYVYDSVLYLSNGGEKLILYDESGESVFDTLYEPKIGANGTGKSISWDGGEWCVTDPTPGIENHECLSDEDSEEDDVPPHVDDNDTEETTSSKKSTSQWIPEPDIYAYAGEDKEVVAGASVTLSGVAGDASGETMKRAEYVWNFGDGEIKRGKSLVHTYRYPGTYIAHLTVISGDIFAHDTITIVAVAPDVQVAGYERGGLDPYVALINSGSEMIDLSYWRIRVAGEMFRIPEYTYIAPKTELRFSRDTMNIDFPETSDVALLYPNLRVVDVLLEESSARGVPISESTQTSVPPRATIQSSSQSYTPAIISSATTPEPEESGGSAIGEERKEEEGSDENMAEEDQTSSVYYSLTANASVAEEGRQAWFFALGGIIILGIAGVTVIHRKDEYALPNGQKTSASQESNADEYEIIEDR